MVQGVAVRLQYIYFFVLIERKWNEPGPLVLQLAAMWVLDTQGAYRYQQVAAKAYTHKSPRGRTANESLHS